MSWRAFSFRLNRMRRMVDRLRGRYVQSFEREHQEDAMNQRDQGQNRNRGGQQQQQRNQKIDKQQQQQPQRQQDGGERQRRGGMDPDEGMDRQDR
jgi:hypothetical protein